MEKTITSSYTLLLAAYQVFLHRLARQEDIIVGSPVAGRSRPEFAEIVGYLLNMVPMRSTVNGAMSFVEFLTQVQHTVLEALDHQDFPSAVMIERLNLHPDSGYPPLFQTTFAVQTFQQGPLLIDPDDPSPKDWGGIKVIPYEIPLFEGQFDLSLEMMEVRSGWIGAMKYNSDVFEHNTVKRMTEQFQALLQGIVEQPDQPIASLPMLSQAQVEQTAQTSLQTLKRVKRRRAKT